MTKPRINEDHVNRMKTKNTNLKFQDQQHKKDNKRTRSVFFLCMLCLFGREKQGRVRESWKLFNISTFHLKNKTYPLKIRYIVKQCSSQQLHGSQESSYSQYPMSTVTESSAILPAKMTIKIGFLKFKIKHKKNPTTVAELINKQKEKKNRRRNSLRNVGRGLMSS